MTIHGYCWPQSVLPGETVSLSVSSDVGELNWVAERLAGADTAQNRARFAMGYAVMGSFTRNKGAVFTVGCTDWAYGLEDPAISQVTQNVMNRSQHWK